MEAGAFQIKSENYDIFADALSEQESVYNFDDSDTDLCEEVMLANQFMMELESIAFNTDAVALNETIWIDDDFQEETFKGDPGLKEFPQDPANINDIVSLFIGEDFFAMLVEESNRYYGQNSRSSQDRLTWREISMMEMKKFLGLIVLMGQIPKDTLFDYWSTRPTIETPFFSKVMSRHRFLQLWRYWHFSNNSEIAEHSDRFTKIAPVYNYFQQKFLSIYKPKQQLCLGRSIIPWRGLCSFQMDNLKNEIYLYGISVGMLCESESGYICNLEVPAGLNKNINESAFFILGPYLNLWHHIYMDDYYSSVILVEELLKAKTGVCGIIKPNKGLPPDLQTTRLNKGQVTFLRRKEVLIQVIGNGGQNNTNLVTTILNAHETKEGSANMSKPGAITEYNRNMRGYDSIEQHLTNCCIVRKTKKWSKRYVMFLINVALLNSYKIYTLLNKKVMSFKDFLHDVAENWSNALPKEVLICKESDDSMPQQDKCPTRRVLKHDPLTRLQMNMSQHNLKPLISRSGKSSHRQCRVCARKKKVSRTLFYCGSCNVPLHKGTCFELYHTYINYWEEQ